MKKSNKKFSVVVTKDGTSTTNDVGTRSGVANFVRELLENAEGGKSITLEIKVEDVAPVAAPVTPAAE